MPDAEHERHDAPGQAEAMPDAAPAEAEERTSAPLDWRVIAIVALAAIFLIAAIVNRLYFGKKKEQTTPTAQQTAPSGPLLSSKEALDLTLRQLEAQSLSTMYTYDDRVFVLAQGPLPVMDEENRNVVGYRYAGLFDISRRLGDFDPIRLHRRADMSGRSLLFPSNVPILGVTDQMKPSFAPAATISEETLHEKERIVGIVVNGEARAYPVKFLNLHELVNDVVGGQPVVVAWTPSAHAASAMLRTSPDHPDKPLTFGISGLMYQAATVLFDFDTGSLWWSVRHQCLAGPMLDAKPPEPVQTVITSLKTWKALHPDSTVMVGTEPATGFEYDKLAEAVFRYLASPNVMFPPYGLDIEKSPLHPKWAVHGVLAPDGTAKAYHFGLLRQLRDDETDFDDTIGGRNIHISYDRETNLFTARDADGAALFTESMIWAAWFGAHPESEVWRSEQAAAMMKDFLEKEKAHLEQARAARAKESPPQPPDAYVAPMPAAPRAEPNSGSAAPSQP